MFHWPRTVARKLFHLAGLDVRARSRWGLDPIEDIRRIIGDGPHTFLDVGANRGQTASLLIRQFKGSTVHSFEPVPNEVNELRALAARTPGINVLPFALGSSEGEMPLNVAAETVGSSLLPWAVAPGQFGAWTMPASRVTVPVRRLDRVMAELKVERAALLKIDTQGFDLEVLKGAGVMLDPNIIRAVMVEVCFQHFYEGQAKPYEVMELLDDKAYRPVAIYEGAREQGGRLSWADMIFA